MLSERIHISERGRRELIVLKRRTGMSQWNHLCRWALCVSLADPNPPPEVDLETLSSVEMSWQTFAGADADIYRAMLLVRCRRDGVALTPEAVGRALHLHLHRGITRLYGAPNVRSMADFVEAARRLARATG